jgi:hypothetical protein
MLAVRTEPVWRGRTKHGRIVDVAAPVVVVVLVFAVSLGIRLTGLDLSSTTDEGYWMQRSIRFGAALARGDLVSTLCSIRT